MASSDRVSFPSWPGLSRPSRSGAHCPSKRDHRDSRLRRGPVMTSRGSLLAPNLLRQFDDHAQLRPLLFLGERVALLSRGKAALRRQAELVECDELGRLVDAALDVVL